MADDGREHITTTEARGGETPGIARYVLGISLVAAVIVMAIVLFIWR